MLKHNFDNWTRDHTVPCLSSDLTLLLHKQEHCIYIFSNSQILYRCFPRFYWEMETVQKVTMLRKTVIAINHLMIFSCNQERRYIRYSRKTKAGVRCWIKKAQCPLLDAFKIVHLVFFTLQFFSLSLFVLLLLKNQNLTTYNKVRLRLKTANGTHFVSLPWCCFPVFLELLF